MNVDDLIAEQVERARRRAAAEKQRRQELAAARKRGLAQRNARRLRNLAGIDLNNATLAASGA